MDPAGLPPLADIVKVEANLRGRIVTSRDELHAVFNELERRRGPQFACGDEC